MEFCLGPVGETARKSRLIKDGTFGSKKIFVSWTIGDIIFSQHEYSYRCFLGSAGESRLFHAFYYLQTKRYHDAGSKIWSHRFYRGANKSLAWPGRKEVYVSVRRAWISFGALLFWSGTLTPARVSMLLKSRSSLTCFRACFLPGRAKDLSASWYVVLVNEWEVLLTGSGKKWE